MLFRFLCLLCALIVPFAALADDQPILVSIGLSSGTVKVDGRTVQAAGVGKRAPWGIHEADVIYETMVYATGQTRLGCLFQSDFPVAVGPVRSARISHFLLQQEWNAACVYQGDAGAAAWDWIPTIDRGSPWLLDGKKNRALSPFLSRIAGRKAPDNLSVDLQSLADELHLSPASRLSDQIFLPDAGISVSQLLLDWGAEESQTCLIYSPVGQQYLMYRCKAPFLCSVSAQDSPSVQLAFDCVVVQHAAYQWPQAMIPVIPAHGEGRADVFFNGCWYACTWTKVSSNAPVRYWDANGTELLLPQTGLYVAQFPADHSFELSPETQAVSYQHSMP